MQFPGSSTAPIEVLELDFVPGAAFPRSPEALGYTEPCLSGTSQKQPQGSREGRRMSERDIDQQLVERAQQGDKHAFELLVSKYQRKLGRLLSRFVRDPGEVEDVTQEAFVKAYRALPSFRGDSAFYTWLYRIGINTAKNYLASMGRRAPTTTNYDAEEAEGFDDSEQLRDLNTPENLLMSKQIAQTVNQSMDRLPEELRAETRLREIEGTSYEDNGLTHRHSVLPHLLCARGSRQTAATVAGLIQRQEMVTP